jgi:hypothetical protein
MKSRLVVGPPPIKYEKKYKKGGKLPKKQLGGMANVGATEQAGLGLLTAGLSAIPGVGAILSPIAGALGSAFLQNKQQKDNFNRQYSNIQVAEKGGKLKSDPPVYVYDAPEVTVTGKKMSAAEKKFSKSIRENPAKYRPSPGNISPTDSPIEYLLGVKKGLPLALKAASKLKDVDLSQLNPNRYKAKEGYMYRGLDEAGMRDAYQSGVFRAKQKNLGEKKPGEVRLEKQFGEVYFTPKFETAKSYGAKYIAEVPRTAANWKQRYGNKDWSQFTSEIPIQQGKILKKDWWKGYKEMTNPPKMEKGGKINKLGVENSLWNNIREKAAQNKKTGATPKKPTKEMLEQERKIKAKMEFGGMLTGKSDLSFYKGRKHANGGIMVSSKGTPSNKPVAEVEGGETRFKLGPNAYIFSDKLTL